MNRNKKIRDKYYEREFEKDKLLNSKTKKYVVKKRGKQHRDED